MTSQHEDQYITPEKHDFLHFKQPEWSEDHRIYNSVMQLKNVPDKCEIPFNKYSEQHQLMLKIKGNPFHKKQTKVT